VIPAGVSVLLVHSLLNHCPVAPGGEQEGVVIELVAVLYRAGVYLGRHPAGVDEGRRVPGHGVGVCGDLRRGLPRGLPLAAGDVEAQVALQALHSLLECATDRGGYAAGMPVESEDAAQSLEPEGIGQPEQHLLGAEIGYDGYGNLPGEPGHAVEQPAWGFSAVQGQISYASPAHPLHVPILRESSGGGKDGCSRPFRPEHRMG